MPDVELERRSFLDANILVYAFSKDAKRTPTAEDMLTRGCCIAVQGLNEFASVAKRKLKFSWPEIDAALLVIRTACPVIVPLDLDIHLDGMSIAARYRLSVYDGLMLAAARKAGCITFWSEDMQDGLLIDGHLRIQNPFRDGASSSLAVLRIA